ncbi:MAG: hypothetical protein P8Y26_06555 [Gemmatimonadales bacterium]
MDTSITTEMLERAAFEGETFRREHAYGSDPSAIGLRAPIDSVGSQR